MRIGCVLNSVAAACLPLQMILHPTRLPLQCEKWKTRSTRLSVSSQSSAVFLKIISSLPKDR